MLTLLCFSNFFSGDFIETSKECPTDTGCYIHDCFFIYTNGAVVLSNINLVVEKSYFFSCYHKNYAAGIYFQTNNGGCAINKCCFYNCYRESGYGQALMVYLKTEFYLIESTVTKCNNSLVSGMFAYAYEGVQTVERSNFSHLASDYYPGLYLSKATTGKADFCTHYGNNATGYICICFASGSYEVNKNNIANCQQKSPDCGVFSCDYGGTVTVKDSVFVNNIGPYFWASGTLSIIDSWSDKNTIQGNVYISIYLHVTQTLELFHLKTGMCENPVIKVHTNIPKSRNMAIIFLFFNLLD